MGMYSDVQKGISESVTIMGVPFFANNIQSKEPINRRERNSTPILGGTVRITKGKYIRREYSFTTTIFFPTGKPHFYDNTFRKMMSKPVEVISEYMGDPFKAEVTIEQTFPENSPNHMELEINIKEIPGVKSKIIGETFKIPKKPKITPKVRTSKQKSSRKTKSNTKKSKSKIKKVKKKNKGT